MKASHRQNCRSVKDESQGEHIDWIHSIISETYTTVLALKSLKAKDPLKLALSRKIHSLIFWKTGRQLWSILYGFIRFTVDCNVDPVSHGDINKDGGYLSSSSHCTKTKPKYPRYEYCWVALVASFETTVCAVVNHISQRLSGLYSLYRDILCRRLDWGENHSKSAAEEGSFSRDKWIFNKCHVYRTHQKHRIKETKCSYM